MDPFLNAARQIVHDGMEESRTPLSKNMEAHAVFTLAKFFETPIDQDRFTHRLYIAMNDDAPLSEFRDIGDTCLIVASFFPENLKRKGMSLRHCVNVGQTAYERTGMKEIALGFTHLIDVLSVVTMAERAIEDILSGARAGSLAMRTALASENVVLFRRGTPSFRQS